MRASRSPGRRPPGRCVAAVRVAVDRASISSRLRTGWSTPSARCQRSRPGRRPGVQLHPLELARRGSPLCHWRDARSAAPCAAEWPRSARRSPAGRLASWNPSPYEQPRADRSGCSVADRRAGVEKGVRRVVVDLLGDHRLDDAEVVGERRRCAGRKSDTSMPDSPAAAETSAIAPWASSSCPAAERSAGPSVSDAGIAWPLMLLEDRLVVEGL